MEAFIKFDKKLSLFGILDRLGESIVYYDTALVIHIDYEQNNMIRML